MAASKDPEKRARQLANLRPAPPAPFGNQRALKTGIKTRTPPGMDTVRAEIMRTLADSAPVRGPDGGLPDADLVSVELLTREICRYRYMDDWVVRHGAIGRGGKLRSIVGALDRSAKTINEVSDRLGMNPSARAKLGLDLMRSFDLAREIAELDDE